MSAFTTLAAETIDDIFEVFGEAADYTPPGGGAATPCIVCIDRGVEARAAEPGDGGPLAGQVAIELRKSEVAAPALNGTFGPPAVSVPGRHELAQNVRVQSRPVLTDSEALVWAMMAVPA